MRLADPPPPGAAPGQWWPPVMVDPAWIRARADDFDVMHLHFGTESFTAPHLADTVAALRETGRPLVYTVHDLTNPQLADQAPHAAQLDVLVPAADALVTLTPGAAAEIRRRWGRAADVVAHPHVLPSTVTPPAGRPRRDRVVGVHLRDLRPNVDGVGATAVLLAAVAGLRETGADVRARVVLHDRVRDEAGRDEVRLLCAGAPFAALVEHPRPGDAELAAALADLDVSVLPYAHGTHSGWLELCWDLGVAVAAPAVGHVAEQHDDPATVATFAPGSPRSLAGALARLLGLDDASARPDPPRPGSAARRSLQERRRADRRTQAREISAAHLALYRRVLADA